MLSAPSAPITTRARYAPRFVSTRARARLDPHHPFALADGRAACARDLHEARVEIAAAHHSYFAMLQHAEFGRREMRTPEIHLLGAVQHQIANVEIELAERLGRKSAAARLVARETRLVKHEYIQPALKNTGQTEHC